MKTLYRREKTYVFFSLGLIVSAVLFLGLQTSLAENLNQAEAGLKAHIDPSTGKFIKKPKKEKGPKSNKASEKAAFNTSDDGLTETPSPVKGGGTVVHLQGRFRSPLTATIDKDGKAQISHELSDSTLVKEREE